MNARSALIAAFVSCAALAQETPAPAANGIVLHAARLLLPVALHGVGVARLGLIGIVAGVPEGPPLAEQAGSGSLYAALPAKSTLPSRHTGYPPTDSRNGSLLWLLPNPRSDYAIGRETCPRSRR